MGLRFSKMHGAGNDFVVLDLRHGEAAPGAALAAAIGNRHTGVGFDQLLIIEKPERPGATSISCTVTSMPFAAAIPSA